MNILIAVVIGLVMIAMNLAFMASFPFSPIAVFWLGLINGVLVLLFIPGRST